MKNVHIERHPSRFTAALMVILIIACALMMGAVLPVAARPLPQVTLPLNAAQTVGVWSRPSPRMGTEVSTAVLPFGNYTGVETGQPTYARSFLWFDLSGLPAGVTIQQATLRLHLLSEEGWPYEGGGDMGVYRVTQDWSEEEVTGWDTRPAADPTLWAQTVVSSSIGATWYEWDITALVRAWQEGTYPNQGLMLSAAPTPETMIGEGWAAAAYGRTGAEPELIPQLVIVYALPPTPTPTPTPQPLPPGVIPEPSTLVLVGGGLLALLGWAGWRSRRRGD